MSSQKSQIVWILCLISFLILGAGRAWGLFHIVRNNSPACSIVIPENPSAQEEIAAKELNYFIGKFSDEKLPESPDSEPLPTGNVILIGTPDSNRYIGELLNNGLLLGGRQFSNEEFIVKVVNEAERDILAIASGQGKGVIYGVYAFAEKMMESITELAPVDLDFYVNPVDSLFVETLNMRSAPFYPIRCTLSQDSLQWMSRHRVNVSGAEGVWSGTGINDGLGTAFKYVNDWQFNDMQDETAARRLTRITDLRERVIELTKRGIDSYLFMYVMGEPTKAMMSNHPELLEEAVLYRFARNGYSYSPISWTKPEARELIKELVRSIVRTYSPWLSGFHLRSWGGETRAPAGSNAEQQALLWEVYSDIIEAAREVNPDFKFLISGYDQSWLHDPERIYAAKLPPKTLFMHKWGIDGEPTSDPGIETEYIASIGEHGHGILVFSHDTEEVMPLWMLEADMFMEGVRKYADAAGVSGLSGFTLQGDVGLSHLDKIVSARAGWDPYEDYVALMHNYLVSYYGISAAPHILSAVRINSLVMADYFSDYAGSLSVAGRYGKGSRGYATRFWNLVGPEMVRDTLAIPDLETAEYAKERLASLLPRQQEAANEATEAGKLAQPVTTLADRDCQDCMHLMKMWVRFFESRLRLVEAREAGLRGDSREQIMQKLSSAAEYSREMQMEIGEIKKFVHVFEYDDSLARESLITAIDEEVEFLRDFAPAEILVTQGQTEMPGEPDLAMTELMNHPNPMSDRAVFCYNLTSSADKVTITIYTIRGRRVRTIAEASARTGRNEENWEAKDDNGRELANGIYLYKIVAERNGKKVWVIDKLSIVR